MRTISFILLVLLGTCSSGLALAASTFSGTYRVNGVDAKLAHMTVMPGGCFHDGIVFVFSEKEVQL